MANAGINPERHYRLLVENVTDYAIFMMDVERRVSSWNEGAQRILGYAEQEILGQSADVIFTPEDRAAGVPEREQETARHVGRAADDRWHLRRDGSRFFASGVMTAVRDDAGAIVGYAKLMRDFTEQKLAAQRLRAEHAVSRVLAEATTMREGMPRVIEAICSTLEWGWGALWVVDEQTNLLRCVESWHAAGFDVAEFELESRRIEFAIGVGLPGRVWQRAVPAWLEDVAVDDNFPRAAAAKATGLHGAIAFPIVAAGRVLGVMECFSRQVRPPDEPLLGMMEVIGRQVGQFVSRRSTERALQRSEARLASVVASALDCIVGMDSRGFVTEWNPAAERTFGFTRDEAIGREMAELIIPPSLRERHRTGLARYLETREGPVIGRRIEINAIRKGGGEFPVELTITRVDTLGPPSFTGHLRDITDRKRADEERQSLLDAERAARTEADQASRLKDEFLATLSHELRTPLNAILGWAQIMKRGRGRPGDVSQGVEVIERNARAQAQIIEDLLDMSRIISGKIRLDVRQIDLTALVQSAVDSVRPTADTKGIHVHAVIDPLAAKEVNGDASRLGQVMWNLLTNAIKFTPREGRVEVELRHTDSSVEIRVSDSGEGINAAFLPFVFDRFRQADASTTRKFGGLGLGLSIVKQLVELHGGSVHVSSEGQGRGATFIVSLPLNAALATTTEVATTRAAGRPSADQADVAGLRVLVVDDEADARTLVQRMLEEGGAIVTTVGSADEAIALIAAGRFDVLVSDIGMPEMDGLTLIRRVRALNAGAQGDLPAIALTAYARAEDRVQAMLAGYQMHLAKPIDPAELLVTIASLARRAHP